MNSKIHALPFDCESMDVYEKHFETDVGRPYTATITLLLSPMSLIAVRAGKLPQEQIERISSTVEMLNNRPQGNAGQLIPVDTTFVVSDHVLWNLLLPQQRNWIVDDIYVQVAYHANDVVPHFIPNASGAYSMTLYDFLVERHQSKHACDHEPIELSAEKTRSLRLHMGQAYQAGLILWNRHLLDHRNMVATMAHAALAGMDPVEAYRKFLESSQFYFLPVEERHWTDANETYVVCGS